MSVIDFAVGLIMLSIGGAGVLTIICMMLTPSLSSVLGEALIFVTLLSSWC
jgi:hypothetical protein